jgi:hypothetical protein
MQHICLTCLQKGIVFSLILWGIPSRAVAQDSHYWAQQYGAAGTLMGGAMVGGVSFSAGLSYARPKQAISLGFTFSFTPQVKIPPYAIINQTPDFTDKA